ncbi:ribosome recycling factor family protein [Vibrio cholerae]|uniref:ribosome recycling factor family protein n=1 Tax=Vibrio cholerae TaxID=666 RepID=UPI0010FE7047|nr:ribosome recycling factor family protein [Vibrio cholerae]EGQ7789954.1 ribosome recycling factor [Vibrio cholerae]EHS1091119.1 ribosome recycling factor family protein [Vibrio cholerae]EJH6265972.1 ribosome recycling factor family protein [Vibrio cholerae]EJL6419771.1 ribosome recycling factor family protein [Vibrio cholerae]EJL6499495.1 ribosome recycling factor family protein [Vibrio cholerae]
MPTTDQAIAITLPSLIHRIGSDTVKRLKLQAQTFDCELKRIRRSRNWQLFGEAALMQNFVIQIKQTEYQEAEYLIRKLETALKQHSDKLEPLETKLQRLISQKPSITLAELMAVTQCSLVQAREARFAQDL